MYRAASSMRAVASAASQDVDTTNGKQFRKHRFIRERQQN
jgi:hypothetical protein